MIDTGEAFTGLEAAIVLIAFVVIASVFSYTLLGSGFLADEMTRETVQEGVFRASGALILSGDIYGISATGLDPPCYDFLHVPLRVPSGGAPVDFSRVSIRLLCRQNRQELVRHNPLLSTAPSWGKWSIRDTSGGDGDSILEPGEQFVINISPMSLVGLQQNKQFTLEIKPSGMAPLRIVRTVPSKVTPVGVLL